MARLIMALAAVLLVVGAVSWLSEPRAAPTRSERRAEAPEAKAPAPPPVQATKPQPSPVAPDPETGVRGRLVDNSARPFAAIDVRAQIGRDEHGALILETGEFERIPSWAYPTVATDEEGRFEIMGLDPRGFHYVFVTPPEGFITGVVGIGRPTRGQVKDLGDIVLYRPARVVGHVEGPSGAPVAGAIVKVGRPVFPGAYLGSEDPMVQRADRIVFKVLQGELPASQLVLGPGVARTDAAGRFELPDIDPGTYQVSCRHAGYLDAVQEGVTVIEGETAGPVDLVLRPAFRLAVVVRDGDGDPVGEADVAISEARGQDGHWYGDHWKGETDATGLARFEAIRRATVQTRILADGYREARRVVSLNAEAPTRLEITLQPGGQMRGRVVVPGKEKLGPRERHLLMVMRSVIRARGGVVGVGVSIDEQGYFEERGLEPGPYELTITAPGFRTTKLGPRLLEAGKTLDWGTIELESGIAVRVHVVDSAGKPVKGARISPRYGFHQGAVADTEGYAILQAGSVGKFPLSAWHADYAWGYADDVEIKDGTVRIEVTITLTRGGTVEGRMHGSDGSVLPRTKVSLSSVEHNVGSTATTDEHGHFRFARVTPGRYRIGGAEFTVEVGQTVVQDARQSRGRALSGRVVDAEGKGVAACKISIGVPRPVPGGGWKVSYPRGNIQTDAQGRFDVPYPGGLQAVQVATPAGRRYVFRVASRTQPVTLPLPDEDTRGPTGTVAGQVTEARTGRALGGATVAISTIAAKAGVTLLRRFQRSCDPQGWFELEVPAGEWKVEISRSDRASETRMVEIGAGLNVPVDVALHRAGRLVFLVKSGVSPAPQARVTIEARITGEPFTVRTKSGSLASRISIEDLRLGEIYAVTIRARDLADYTGTYEAGPGTKPPVEVELTQAK